ncbi:MAG: SpoIIE family protein phosphatase [Phycisphaerales bacterium]
MNTTVTMPPLRLEPVAGPTTEVLEIPATAAPIILGRSAQCDVVLMDPDGVVSRRHCEFRWDGEAWCVADLGSRHGTWVNQIHLAPERPVPICDGDRLRIGLCTFRAGIGDRGTAVRVHTLDDQTSSHKQFQRFAPQREVADSHRRLELLMACASAVGGAVDEREIARAATEALALGCGFPRAAMVRAVRGAEQVDVLAARDTSRSDGDPVLTFSRSLIQACADGQTVVLNSADTPKYGQSIVSLGIASAVCTPVMFDGTPDAYLYLDSRGEERTTPVTPDVAGFCQAVARLCAMALAGLHRTRLELDRKRRHAELEAARDVQAIIMPPARGTHDGISYAMRSVPGRYVAGDLFDFIPIGPRRAAVLLGDVAGKGVAAGMVMSNVQAHLSRLLRANPDPGAALNEVNGIVYEYSQRYNTERGGMALFLSLLVAVVDADRGTITWGDAGHGHWLLRPVEGPIVSPGFEGGPPVGVVHDTVYLSYTRSFARGERLLLYSDGVVEQRSVAGEEFGVQQAIRSVAASRSAAEDADMMLDAVMRHAGAVSLAGESPFADDVTIAVVEMT